MFALDSDAHSNLELTFAAFAIAHARVAAVPADRVISCWDDDHLLALADQARR